MKLKTVQRTMMVGGISVAGFVAIAHADTTPQYPKTEKTDHVDVLHGVEVPDPYRWLEDDVRTNQKVRSWVTAENKTTFGYLEALPQRERIIEELTQLWNYEKFSAPFRRGDQYFYFRNDGLQNQSVLYVTDDFNSTGRVLLDPNTLREDGTVALSGTAFTDDGRYMAYGLASSGSDWNDWHVRDVSTGRDLPDEIRWVKFSGASWAKDGSGFYYSRYPETHEGDEYHGLNYNQRVYFHTLGTNQSEDKLIYEQPKHPDWGFGAQVTEDGRYLVVTTWKGTDNKYLISYADLQSKDNGFRYLIDKFDADYTFVGNDGPTFFFKTDKTAPKNRLIAINTRQPEPANWNVIIPEADEVLRGVNFVNNQFVASYLKDAVTKVRIFDTRGRAVRDVKFPSLGSAGGFGGKREYTETFYTFSSFAVPPSVYRYDLRTGKSTLLRQAKVGFDPDDYTTTRVFYPSKDGTKVPLFLTHKKDIKLDGSNPTLLYGYGGFDISLTPNFSVTNLMWMKMGGIYAQANLRGGGEYGKAWHDAGRLYNKQNVFDDFIAAAQWLIKNKYTSTEKLAIRGGSNGGLLVGACMTQRPDLFGVALPAVGVMDMLRFHKFTAGRFWVDDYGSPDDPKMFKYLLSYSPYHNLRPGTSYPATLITTADTDDRVVPGHSFKFAARLQEDQSGDAPVLIRIETSAGHGAGKPTTKRIEEAADILAFTAKNLHMKVNLPQH